MTAPLPAPSNESGRLPRFSRDPRQKPPFALQSRDVAIIRLVAQHRVISSGDIQLVVGGSGQGVLRRLQRLYHHGYLDRPRCQIERGNAPLVHALGQRGADLVAQETGQRAIADWSEKNRQLQSRHLEHGLMATRFAVALGYAADSLGTIRLERWYGDGFIRDAAVVEHRDRQERIPIAPDALFVLRLLETGEAIHGLLEADRSTMQLSRFIVKLRGYFAWWRSGRQEEVLGAKNCLVLTVTKSAERARNLLGAARSVNSRGTRMFLFCCEREFLPTNSRRILDAIWHTPADESLHSLLE